MQWWSIQFVCFLRFVWQQLLSSISQFVGAVWRRTFIVDLANHGKMRIDLAWSIQRSKASLKRQSDHRPGNKTGEATMTLWSFLRPPNRQPVSQQVSRSLNITKLLWLLQCFHTFMKIKDVILAVWRQVWHIRGFSSFTACWSTQLCQASALQFHVVMPWK